MRAMYEMIAGMKVLEIEAIAQPATEMLSSILAVIPNLIGALAIIAMTVWEASVAH